MFVKYLYPPEFLTLSFKLMSLFLGEIGVGGLYNMIHPLYCSN